MTRLELARYGVRDRCSAAELQPRTKIGFLSPMRSITMTIGTYQLALSNFDLEPLSTHATTRRNIERLILQVIEVHLPRIEDASAVSTRRSLKLIEPVRILSINPRAPCAAYLLVTGLVSLIPALGILRFTVLTRPLAAVTLPMELFFW